MINHSAAAVSIFLGMITISCDRVKPDIIPDGSEYTGGRWSSGHWLHCRAPMSGEIYAGYDNTVICTHFRTDASIFQIGIYIKGVVSEITSTDSWKSGKPVVLDTSYFRDQELLRVFYVRPESDGTPNYFSVVVPSCRSSLIEGDIDTAITKFKGNEEEIHAGAAFTDISEVVSFQPFLGLLGPLGSLSEYTFSQTGNCTYTMKKK